MSYSRPHLKCTFIGDGWSAQEIWQTSLRLDTSTLPTVPQQQAISAAFADFMARPASGIAITQRFLSTKFAIIGVDGKYPPNGESVEYVLPSPIAGGGPGMGHPQLSTVITFLTQFSRGKGVLGRMFPPATAFSPQNDGRMATATALALAQSGGALIAEVNDAGAGEVTVFGETGAGTAYAVEAVRVGRVIDTQRRRRNAIPEQGVEAPLVP